MTTTKLSNVYDGLITLIGTALPAYTKIPNPYEPSNNASLLLTKGFGLGFSTASNTKRQICRIDSTSRNFVVVLINRVTATDHDTTAHATLEKSLLEDLETIKLALANDITLGGKAAKAEWQDDSGIEYLENDRAQYLSVQSTIGVEYFDTF
jgi:hypothetical protein